MPGEARGESDQHDLATAGASPRVSALPDLTPLGLAVGHASDFAGATGLTVVRGIDKPLRAGAATYGRATGSRELHAISVDHSLQGRVDAIMLTGGSAYGLDAAAGVMRWMEERGRGLPIGTGVVPIVPAAVVYDLTPLGRFDARPTAQMAYDACASATSTNIAEGSVGGGTGTTVGKMLGPGLAMKGGFGCAIDALPDGSVSVAAMVVVNALGDVRGADGRIIAGARKRDGGFADATLALRRNEVGLPVTVEALSGKNTTLAVVAASVPLGVAELNQLARAAGAALFRRITPVGSTFDGDVVFAVSPESGDRWVSPMSAARRGRLEPMILEALAVAALEEAIDRAVRLARGRDGIPGLADDDHDH